jgi:hypothetical protein
LFKASWEMKRKFSSGKESGSEYDLSLAAFALQAEWSWQETVNLLIAFRRTNGLKPKTVIEGDPTAPLRGGYYSRTLSMAQRGQGLYGCRAAVELMIGELRLDNTYESTSSVYYGKRRLWLEMVRL